MTLLLQVCSALPICQLLVLILVVAYFATCFYLSPLFFMAPSVFLSDEQLIKTDSTNILIRALTLKKEKGRTEQKSKDNKGKVAAAAAVTPEEGNGKR
jgi:hypothetical protein